MKTRSDFHHKCLLSIKHFFGERLDQLLRGGGNERENLDDGGAELKLGPAKLRTRLVGIYAKLEPLLQMLHQLETELLIEDRRKKLR